MSRSPLSPSTPSPKSSVPDLAKPAGSAAPANTPPESTGPVVRPRLTFADASEHEGRRPSVQFAARNEWGLRAASPKPHPPQITLRRMSSPPPPSTYESRVSFDTFDNRDATDYSFTLVSKHKHYAYTPRSRTFLCGADSNDYSEFALEWLVDELVEDGDEIVCLRVVDRDSKINSDASLQEGKYKVEAKKLLEHIQNKNNDDEKSISVILEFAVGKVQDTIQRMINIYSPACLIVGTRGRSLGGFQGLLPGSVSKFCLQNSPVPVVVVRPTAKREKKKKKRLADPTRRGYINILEKSGASGSQMLDKSERDKVVGPSVGEASEVEAQAVANAIGLPGNIGVFAGFRKEGRDVFGEPLSRVASAKTDYTIRPDSPSTVGALSPDHSVPGESRSPEFERLDSPAMSDDEEARDEEVPSERHVKKTAIDEARKMEAGEGKHLKPMSSIMDDT
ncbi:hypothetical protein MMC07_002779 [Pseudocyphellaria aurata]|nr:hypothetical protein [Pseudocyphellaria aurata]